MSERKDGVDLTPEAVLRAIRLKEGRPIGDDA